MQSILADMRNVLAKNPQIEQQKLIVLHDAYSVDICEY
jgi:hypothetical protein